MNYKETASQILRGVGGQGNIENVYHCSTRLRFKLKDDAKADKKEIEQINGVIGVVNSGGQFQVIIGNDVSYVYRELPQNGDVSLSSEKASSKKKFSAGSILEVISAIFQPLVPAVSGAGMLKVLLLLCSMTGILSTDSQTYIILNNLADAAFYFLPVLVAYSTAVKFRSSVPLAMTVSAALLHPKITALFAEGNPLSLFGIPVTPANYGGQVVPIILIVLFMGYIQRFADKVSPNVVKIFLSPLIVILITGPVALLALGPIGVFLGNGLTEGILLIQQHVGFVAVAILAVLMPIFVSLGIHKVFIPIMVSTIANPGYDMLILVAHLCSNFAQSAASFAVATRTKSKSLRQLAISSGVTASFGISEPALYGVTMKLKKPLYAAMAGAGIAGIFAGLMQLKAYVPVGPGFASLPMFVGADNNFLIAIITLIISFIATFIIARFIGFNDPVDPNAEVVNNVAAQTEVITSSQPAASGKTDTVNLFAPLRGKSIPLSEVSDEVFSKEMMGKGIAFLPEDNILYSPMDGTVSPLYKSKHALGLVSEDGVELLIHIGIDTVKMKGSGFKAFVNTGDTVSKGDKLIEFDMDAIKAFGLDTTTMMIVTNTDKFSEITGNSPAKVQPGDAIMTLTKGDV
ncbi:PTS glucose transporter subunit IIA [Paenibacillus sp. JNUCC31]|uniref:beta-glucoside-specific PTS transporter subunit IIABC n=1 Tax=Paenibacillus sp. JNUCC-31 TaxID=2777983 RepID=UPI00177A904C|nr:beta-glucoside-specific PTS transporter subunit IIABC [Paenibacillus sp. JNUCC-31]QOS79468.1 PTS glucose transporter subunit IIA [Paenibacillus sp. JNUCC-31]